MHLFHFISLGYLSYNTQKHEIRPVRDVISYFWAYNNVPIVECSLYNNDTSLLAKLRLPLLAYPELRLRARRHEAAAARPHPLSSHGVKQAPKHT